MANRKILTVEEQEHLLSTLPEIFQGLTQAEIQDIIVKLGLQDLLDQNGNLISVYTVDVYSNKPTYIISDYNIKVRGNAYNKGILANDEVTSWRWERISGVPAEDTVWAQGKNTQEITLSESDFTSRIHTRDITFKVYPTIKNTEYSDEITYSKSQIFNKIQVKASHDLFLENSPSSITLTTIEEGTFSDYKWYLGNNLVSTTRNFSLSVNSIPLRGFEILKVEAKDSTGKIYSDTKTIPRISNGANGEPGIPGESGNNSYIWVKYSDSSDGLNMSDYPVDSTTGLSRKYIGIAYNKSTSIESNNPSDYTWIKYVGTDGVQGPQGPQGINGTSGPIPRLLEFVQGQEYKNGGLYIDYAYFRSNNINEGWYTVKLPAGHTPGTEVSQIYTGGIPDNTKFDKAPFTKEMSFGTVIAEQANLAGFIFRNQVLTSQASGYQKCGTTQLGPYPNLTIDGIYGVIKFLERLFLNKDGIVMKDDCGKPRIKFGLDGTKVPVLQFLNEDGTIKWEAGKNGYQVIVTGTQPSTWNSFKVAKLSGMDSYNESAEIEILDTDLGIYKLNNTVKSSIQSELNTKYQVMQLSCDGETTLGTSYSIVWGVNAFNTLVHEYQKGDMAADINNYTGIYLNQTPILESDVATAPVGTFPENGWYLIEGLSGANRNSENICYATQGVYPFMESYSNPGDTTIYGHTIITIGYIKNGKVVRNINIVEKEIWESNQSPLEP